MSAPDTKAMERLKRLAEKATPGPWEPAECGGWSVMAGPTLENRRGYIKGGRGQVAEMDDLYTTKREQKANARFIAAANPSVILDLLARVAELEAERDTWKRHALDLRTLASVYNSVVQDLPAKAQEPFGKAGVGVVACHLWNAGPEATLDEKMAASARYAEVLGKAVSP